MIRLRDTLDSTSPRHAWFPSLRALVAGARRRAFQTGAGLALVGMALLAPVGFAPAALADILGNSGLGAGGGGGGGDEGIGSLPSMVGGPGPLLPGAPSAGGALAGKLAKLDAGAPNLWIEGQSDLVVEAIALAWGSGYVTIQAAGQDRVRLYFHGDVKVAVTATAFESGQLSAGVWLSQAYQGGIAAIEWNGNWTAPIVVARQVALPIAAAAHIGVFRNGTVNLHLGSLQSRKHTTVGVAAQRGLIVLSQDVH
ncbi:MAG: hypothetical protein FJ299_13930 [Planctomycetes bacterium]|nr:hypothetical protein [Planctomycetota bacterium]